MSDEEEDDETPSVSLGEATAVEGVPLARVSSRLTWGMSKSDVLDREGETTIRTQDGPRDLAEIFESIDLTYFESRHEFETAIRDVIGVGPVDTDDEE